MFSLCPLFGLFAAYSEFTVFLLLAWNLQAGGWPSIERLSCFVSIFRTKSDIDNGLIGYHMFSLITQSYQF